MTGFVVASSFAQETAWADSVQAIVVVVFGLAITAWVVFGGKKRQ